MSNTDTMKEVYLLAQEHCGLKVGDSVKVTRVAENNEGGWPNSWYIEKDKYIGETGKIIKITPSMGICVQFGNDPNRADMAWYFPYFVLEKRQSQRMSSSLLTRCWCVITIIADGLLIFMRITLLTPYFRIRRLLEDIVSVFPTRVMNTLSGQWTIRRNDG